jgi:2-octaprenyl-6-methoxyphenol hydroxylase
MNKFLDCDALIVGGGLAGAASALSLADAGFGVILLDAGGATAEDAAEFDGRAYAVALASQRFWAAIGVWDRVAAEAEPMVDILVSDGKVDEGASPLFLHLDHRETDDGVYGYMVEDRHLRPAVLAAMDDHERVEQRAGRVTTVDYGPGRAVASLADGGTIHASVVIACDGRDSPLGAAAGIRRMSRRYQQNGLVCAVGHEKPHHGVAHEMFLPSGPFAILPLRGDRSSLVWTETNAEAARIHALDDDAYLVELQRRFGDFLGKITLEGRRWTYPLHLSLAHEYVKPRLALLGDAAHAVHPIAGQGLNLGVRDAAALAEVLCEAAGRGEDIGGLDVLRRYQNWRRFDSTSFALGMDALNILFSNDSGPIRLIRDLGMAAVNKAPKLKTVFMKMASGVSGETPKLMRGERL